MAIYSSFAKEGNLGDLFAKMETISTLLNVVGIGVGVQLASNICSMILSIPIRITTFELPDFQN